MYRDNHSLMPPFSSITHRLFKRLTQNADCPPLRSNCSR